MRYKVTVQGPAGESIDVLVHAVNWRSARAVADNFFERYNRFEVKLTDAPKYCISLPDLGINESPDRHQKLASA